MTGARTALPRRVPSFTDNTAAVIEHDRITAAVLSVDQVAREMERRWGVGRLVRLVSPETLLRFRQAHRLWTQAYSHDRNVAETERTSAMMIRAWKALDAEATATGHAPLAPTVWEGRTEDGRALVITRTSEEALAIASTPDERARTIWTVDELARCVAMFEQINAIKRSFPGALVTAVSPRAESFASDWATSDPLLDVLHPEPLAPGDAP
jgi:hypothetical protein